MTWRFALGVALAVALLVVSSPPRSANARQSSTAVRAESTRDAAIAQRSEAQAQLEDVESELVADEEALLKVRRSAEDLGSRIVQVDGQIEINKTARREIDAALIDPTRLQAELALQVYVAGEPTLNAILATVRTGEFDTRQERERVIFSTVRRRLLDRIAELELTQGRLERVAGDLETVRGQMIRERAQAVESVAAAEESLAEDRRSAEILRTNLRELDELIASLPLPTTTAPTGGVTDATSSVTTPPPSTALGTSSTAAATATAATGRSAASTTVLGSLGSSSTSSAVPEATTTTTLARDLPFRHVLTGVPTDALTRRPALAVKIDNAANARPQAGLNQADIVFEEIVEGGRTRFVAVFQSTAADPIGPIRSARTSDLHILSNLNSPLFANSGANPGTLGLIAQSSLANVNVNRAPGAYFRSAGRRAPHNLYSRTASLWNVAPASAGVPPETFLFRPNGFVRPNPGRSIERVSVAFGAETVTYAWNGAGWERSAGGRATVDSSGVRVAPTNVIVQFIEYGQSPIDSRSPEALVVGSGSAWVLTAGRLIEGSWHRPGEADVTRYLDAAGEPILLEPGPTWIALPRLGSASVR